MPRHALKEEQVKRDEQETDTFPRTRRGVGVDLSLLHKNYESVVLSPDVKKTDYKAWLLSVLDRAVRTALQTVAGYLTIAQMNGYFDYRTALLAAAFSATLSILTSLVTTPSFGENYTFQLLERLVKTYVQNLVTYIGTATFFSDVSWRTAFYSSLVAAGYSLVTSVLTTRVGMSKTDVDLNTPTRT